MRTAFLLGSMVLCLAPQARGQIAFGPELVLFTFEEYGRHVALGDADDDGRPDLFMRTDISPYAVFWYPNLGGGAYGVGTEEYSGQWSSLPEMLDIDIDGYSDLVYGCLGGTCWQEGLGAGSFGPPEQLSAHSGATPRLVDVDGDGIQDIYLGTGWLKSDGSGGYEPHAMPFGDHPNVVDVNEDGFSDVIFSTGMGPYYVESRMNDGSGDFGGSNFIAGYAALQDIFVMDITNDGDADVVLRSDSVLKLMENEGNGTFGSQSMAQTLFAGSIRMVITVDPDADGDVDFLKMGTNDLTLLVNNGSGIFNPQLIHAFDTQPIWLGCADVDGDGRQDVMAGFSHWPNSNFTVSWFPALVGIETSASSIFSVSPNPMDEYTWVELKDPMHLGTRIEILDASGRVLRKLAGDGTRQMRIERGDLATGIYVVRLAEANGTMGTVRLMAE